MTTNIPSMETMMVKIVSSGRTFQDRVKETKVENRGFESEEKPWVVS